MLSIRASQNAKRRKKTLRALLSKPSSKSKQASKWATLGADKTSQQLHQYAANQTSRMAIIIFFAYLILAYILAYVDGMRGVDPFYFFATTVTTVGFGDLVLTQQNTRAAAIVLLPLGLIVIGFSMSFMQAKLAEHAAEHHKNYKDKLSLVREVAKRLSLDLKNSRSHTLHFYSPLLSIITITESGGKSSTRTGRARSASTSSRTA